MATRRTIDVNRSRLQMNKQCVNAGIICPSLRRSGECPERV
jgi:hypothetical protein